MGVIVVPLPDPSLAVISEREEHGVPSSTTQCLNDDILREIANYLEWADQVALSTTSRHIHRLELPCLRQYTCETASQLQALYQYLTKDPITSTRRIARLGYLRLVCADYEAVLGSTKKFLQAVEDVLQITGTSTSLRRLEISYPTSIPREAGASLKHVTHVRFTSDESLPSPGAFPEALRSLHIGGHKGHMYLAISQLYLHLTRLPALSKLMLDRVNIEDPEGLHMETGDDNGGSNDPIPSFPTIQTLRFLYCGYLTDTTELPLSKTFPNLSTLEIKGGPMGIEDYDSTTEHHLRSFIFDSFDETLPKLWSVDHITYTNPNVLHTVFDMYQVTSCDDLVSLRLRTNIEDPFFKWNDLAEAVPELRLLEIESYFTSTRETLGLLVSLIRPNSSRHHGSPSLFACLGDASRANMLMGTLTSLSLSSASRYSPLLPTTTALRQHRKNSSKHATNSSQLPSRGCRRYDTSRMPGASSEKLCITGWRVKSK